MLNLMASGVPAEVRTVTGEIPTYEHIGPCHVWVLKEVVEDARWVLDKPTAAAAELERLALQSPPPDDA
jgi:hypothetical protein